ncbi:MAG: phospholipase [Verrucomicrobiae bacterium]|nr:phospholipase [Verrucomicrobiae bacterium]
MKYDLSFFTVWMVVLCFLTTSLKASEDFQEKVYTSSEGESLVYRIHIPEAVDVKKHDPLILFFHGAGERGNDNNKQLIHGVKDILAYANTYNMPSIIVVPQCPAGEQWVNTPWGADAHTMPENPSASMKLTIALLKELQSTFSVDQTRIYVTGLSMGGFGTWDIIQRMPNTFAAAMPVCGGGDTEMADAVKHIPAWVFHGGADGVVNPKRARDMVAALEKIGGKVQYTEYEGVGHNAWTRTYANEDVLKWLFSQKKSEPYPEDDILKVAPDQ